MVNYNVKNFIFILGAGFRKQPTDKLDGNASKRLSCSGPEMKSHRLGTYNNKMRFVHPVRNNFPVLNFGHL